MKFKDMPYERVNMDELEKEFKQLMEEFQAAKSGEEQFEVHKKYYALSKKVMTNMTVARIRHDIDTTDEFYKGEQDFIDNIEPMLNNIVVAYQKLMYESPYRSYLEEKSGRSLLRT